MPQLFNLPSKPPLIPKLTKFCFLTALLFLSFFTLYRIVFWAYFSTKFNTDILTAFYIGLKFDWRLAMILVLPIMLVGWIKWFNPVRYLSAKFFWHTYLILAFTIVSIIYFLDFGHYSYLKTHINPTVTQFAQNAGIAIKMLWQSYPVVWLGIAMVFLICLFYLILWRIEKKLVGKTLLRRKLWQRIIINTFVAFVVIMSLYAKFSFYPLRWADAYFSNDSVVADVAANPVLFLYYATINQDNNRVDKDKLVKLFPKLKEHLKLPNNKPLDFKRPLIMTPQVNERANLVIVFLESFAAYKTGSFANPLNSSPNFDNLAKDGMLFKRFYVSQTGTARSVFTTITGIPDTHPNHASTHDQLIVEQNTIVNAFDDYNKFYFIGGSANWGNIRGLLSRNIKNFKIVEEGDFSSKRQDVWGISDADLFLESAELLKTQTTPFVAIIQTAGNHRPYTIPKPDYDFKLLQTKESELKKYGFASLKELNSFRFLDHSVGLFIEKSKQYGFYDNTVFVFFGDHGISYDNGQHRPRVETEQSVGSHNVPLLIHAPKYINAQQINTITSHADILPVIAGLMNKPYDNTSLGRNVLAPIYHDSQYAFTISGHGGMPELGLISQDFYFKMNSNGTRARIYDLKGTTANVADKYPKDFKNMKDLTQAIYEAARYLVHHNK